MKEFTNKNTSDKLLFYERNGLWFYKHVRKGSWLKKAREVGPFDSEGDALLSVCVSRDIHFSNFEEIQ